MSLVLLHTPGGESASLEADGVNLESRPTFLGGRQAILEPTQREELISASLGIKAGKRGASLDPPLKANTIHAHRHYISRLMGAESTTQAVGIGILSGIVPIELADDNASGSELDLQSYQMLFLASKGLTSERIAEELEISKSTIVNYYRDIRELLEAKNRPHATRRAFETKILLPTPELSEMCLDSINKALRTMNAFPGRAGFSKN